MDRVYVIEYFHQEAWESDTTLDAFAFKTVDEAIEYLQANGYTEPIMSYKEHTFYQQPNREDEEGYEYPRWFTGAEVKLLEIIDYI